MEDGEIYLIMVEGHINEKWRRRFEDVELVSLKDGNTMLKGKMSDQAVLYSVLMKIMDLGLKLISVERQIKNEKGSFNECN
jgi:hypothetical protein